MDDFLATVIPKLDFNLPFLNKYINESISENPIDKHFQNF